jgi:c-di-GMP-binding flagellar brake protein YcgR
MEERRRSPRRTAHGKVAIVSPTLSVQLLDISAAGVLLRSNQQVERGSEGRLNLNLEGLPLRAGVRIARVESGEGPTGYRLGARFVGLTPDHRQLIKRFIAK